MRRKISTAAAAASGLKGRDPLSTTCFSPTSLSRFSLFCISFFAPGLGKKW